MAIKQDAAFDAFVASAQSMLGSDLSRDWLFEIWVGADADANRALNHALDSPEDKIKRNGGGGKTTSDVKTPKKAKPVRESKPAPLTPATTWGDDDYDPPAPQPQRQSMAPGPQQASQPAAAQGQGYPQAGPMPYQSQQGLVYPMSQPMMQQPMMMQQPLMTQQPMMSQQPMMMQQPIMTQQPMMMQQPGMMLDPMTGLPMAPMSAIQQAQTMFVQQQQQQRLTVLKSAIDSVLANPNMLMSPQIMQNLQDTMIQALEAPNATLQLAERARQSQQTAQFITIMQAQVAQMLADPKVATNPALLQQLNSQMNQLRLLTMQHVAQQQIEANPTSVLSLSMPLLTPPSPSATLLSRALLQGQNSRLQMDEIPAVAQGVPVIGGNDEDWWQSTPKAASRSSNLSEKNPFRDANDAETTPPMSRKSLSRSLSVPSLTGLPMFGSAPSLVPPQSFSFGYPPQLPASSAANYTYQNMYGGPNPLFAPPQNQLSSGSSILPYMYGSQQAGYMPPRPF